MEKIHPETGEILHRDVRKIEYTYKGESIIVDMPGWYPVEGDEGIFTQEDMKIWGDAVRTLKARHKAKMHENNLDFGNVAFA